MGWKNTNPVLKWRKDAIHDQMINVHTIWDYNLVTVRPAEHLVIHGWLLRITVESIVEIVEFVIILLLFQKWNWYEVRKVLFQNFIHFEFERLEFPPNLKYLWSQRESQSWSKHTIIRAGILVCQIESVFFLNICCLNSLNIWTLHQYSIIFCLNHFWKQLLDETRKFIWIALCFAQKSLPC